MQKANNPKRGPGKAANRKAALSAQQTIPYLVMHRDGVCQLPGGLYTKTVEYEDINYSVASTEDQTAIFSGWSSFLNYFDSSLPFQLSFINRRSRSRSKYKVNISPAQDDFDSIRAEFTSMLKNQIAKSNNGIERSKYITFGLPAEGIAEARPRLERVEADVTGNLKRLGVPSAPMDGQERLALLHSQMHPGSREPFRFSWQDIPRTGMGTKDFIAPDSFDFRQSRTFRIGQYWGAASYLQILASELSDKLLAEILELDAEMTVTMHIQTVDQLKAIKTIKGKLSDIGKMKVEEQRKAVRAGYDPDILPPDLITFSKDAAELLADLQSRNERMFLLTFTVINIAPTRQRLENDVFTVGGIAQKYNCALKRLDWQQEQAFVSSLALGYNEVEIQRGMTTSSTAIFIPFMTRELRMAGPSLYYGMNALSHNVIMADRKKLKSANGLYLGSTGSGKSFAAKREIINVFLTIPKDRIIVIDYDKPVDEEGEQYETYFFSVVDEADLLAAAEAAGVEQAVCSCSEKCEAGAVNTDCAVCSVNMSKCVGVEPEPEPTETEEPAPEEAEPETGGNMGMLLAVLAVALVGGGAAFYFKVLRPKQQKAAAPQEDYGDELTDYDEPDGYGDEDDDGPPWDEEDDDGEEADK